MLAGKAKQRLVYTTSNSANLMSSYRDSTVVVRPPLTLQNVRDLVVAFVEGQ